MLNRSRTVVSQYASQSRHWRRHKQRGTILGNIPTEVEGSKGAAPGEARTRNPGIAPVLSYKYRALTNCATGAATGVADEVLI